MAKTDKTTAYRRDKTFRYQPEQLKTFWYWMNERHRIWQKRYDGVPYPWTKDPILTKFKFTNVFRQLDRVTEAWTDRFVKLLGRGKSMTDGDLMFHCVMFRLFNWPETYDTLFYTMPYLELYSLRTALKALDKRREEGHKIFTGAYIVSNGGSDDRKVRVYCKALAKIFKRRHEIAERIVENRSMEEAVNVLCEQPLIGRFVAYEIACDLRHTRILGKAQDVVSWANPGPGAVRGINRLMTGKKQKIAGLSRPFYIEVMRDLYKRAQTQFKGKCEWPFELREIEHSLCEFDKYVRVKNGEGRPRSTFTPIKVQKELSDWYDDEKMNKLRNKIKNERRARRKINERRKQLSLPLI